MAEERAVRERAPARPSSSTEHYWLARALLAVALVTGAKRTLPSARSSAGLSVAAGMAMPVPLLLAVASSVTASVSRRHHRVDKATSALVAVAMLEQWTGRVVAMELDSTRVSCRSTISCCMDG